MSSSASTTARPNTLHWFRKGLRLHHNPALVEACSIAQSRGGFVYPVFCIDPVFAKPDVVGINRYNFLLQSLSDLDTSLRAVGSRLYVARGKPEEQIPMLLSQWNADVLTFESDTEPYARQWIDCTHPSIPYTIPCGSIHRCQQGQNADHVSVLCEVVFVDEQTPSAHRSGATIAIPAVVSQRPQPTRIRRTHPPRNGVFG